MDQVKEKKKSRFRDIQTGYHRSAVNILASWVNGSVEEKFFLRGDLYFVPDVTVYKNGEPNILYEVVYKNEITGSKLERIQLWCYCNAIDMVIYEVSADWILSQIKKPKKIKVMEKYEVTVF